ncbi:cyclophilin-type peptidyl-prolyl cis-trans isomerase [Kipferlia bialata]|uniref:peptidylprolyl isomerase n=1 Tax=Kipferlia bialata TaxID=797122 RepID=A0A9K3GGY3_9EUKA|nr:cyclophilin-type peptidyl-prolyl cis-trans isomerase [Kipferlia bialata]|eukprot:g3785.t1
MWDTDDIIYLDSLADLTLSAPLEERETEPEEERVPTAIEGLCGGAATVLKLNGDEYTLARPLDKSSVDFIRYGNGCVISGSTDGVIKVWRRKAETTVEYLKQFKHKGGVVAICVSTCDRYMATLSTDKTMHVYALDTMDIVNTVSLPHVPSCACFSHHPRAGATVCVGSSVNSGISLIRALAGEREGDEGTGFNADMDFDEAGPEAEQGQERQTETDSDLPDPVLKTLSVHIHPVVALGYCYQSNLLLSVDVSGMPCLHDMATLAPPKKTKKGVTREYIDHTTGLTLPTHTPPLKVSVSSPKKRQRIISLGRNPVLGISPSPDGSMYALSHADFVTTSVLNVVDGTVTSLVDTKELKGGEAKARRDRLIERLVTRFGRRREAVRSGKHQDPLLPAYPRAAWLSPSELMTPLREGVGVWQQGVGEDGAQTYSVVTRGLRAELSLIDSRLTVLSTAVRTGSASGVVTLDSQQTLLGDNLMKAVSLGRVPISDVVRESMLFFLSQGGARFYIASQRGPKEEAVKTSSRDVVIESAVASGEAQGHKHRTAETGVILHTTMGDIEIEFYKEAIKTVYNMVTLCKRQYYDGVIFHRIIRNFMVQGGDPTGTGTGGSSAFGAPFEDEIIKGLSHTEFTVSMANSGPNTNNSQFFITTVACPHLDGKHTVFGRVKNGQRTVKQMEQVATRGLDRPVEPIIISSTTLII